jgi:nucleoside-diphosphate-sugar epimerase
MYLVTGANGFIGSALMARLISDGEFPVAAVRNSNTKWENSIQVGDLELNTDWSLALKGVRVVVHTAARVHVMRDYATCPLTEYRRVNVAATINLAKQAAAAGVKRFIFISSIKVNGDETETGRPFTEKDRASPADAYGLSKYEAEQGLRLIAKDTGMEIVIIRPVLVYGIGVKGNFQLMMGWLRRSIPLPLGGIKNARSLVALDNLVDLIITCMHHPAAANQTFFVSDGDDISTSELVKYTASAMGVRPILIFVPSFLIKVVAKMIGRADLVQRLCGNLQVDISKAGRLLGWQPIVSVKEGLRRVLES